TFPNQTVGVPYSQSISATGGTGPYSYAVTSGTLPPGFTLSSAGLLSGTPTTAGSTSFTVTATDAATCTGSNAYVMVVNPPGCPTILLQPSSLPNATVGQTYNLAITASGGTAPYTFAISAGTLPSGLTLTNVGVLSGVPLIQGNYAFSVTATDNHIPGCTGIQLYTLVVGCPAITLSPASLPQATIGTAYSQTIAANGGTGPYTFAITSGSLPPGITLSSAGVLSGVPTVAGISTFTVTVVDVDGCVGNQAYSLVVMAACPTIALSPSSLTGGTSGLPYSQTITASGGTSPYSFAVTSGTLPAGITLSSSGTLSGTPTVPGTYNFTVTATDAFGCTGSWAYSLVIGCPTIVLSPASLTGGTLRLPYSQAITASGGISPFSFAVTSGTLPTGLTLSSSGTLSGIPTVPGTYTFTVTATDASGCTGNRAYSLVIACPAIAVSSISPHIGTAGLSYSDTFTAGGGTGPYTFSVSSGNLPAGLTLSSGGILSGIPTTAGTFNFTVTATDANGCAGYQANSLVVVNGPMIIHIKTTPDCTPFKLIVKGSNLQPGIKVYIDGVQWYYVAWKNTGKIVLKGPIHAAVHSGMPHTFTFVNPDGGVASRSWRYVRSPEDCR
ncbi:MAG: Ig domain-containing protein, partial [Acidobacteriota bacterium]